ncbi:MAG: benzoate transporter [Gammaproteobacteria bacterium]|nr:benzoate transporter [Gammaproteobacteria bacterium]
MNLPLEKPATPRAGLRRMWRDFGLTYAANGFVGWLFAVTAPVAIILSVGSRGGLSEAEIASWVFGVFFVNGLISILFCWLYREPLVFFWTIPGTVLVGPSLAHLSFAEVVGAFYLTGSLMFVLSITGWVRRAMAAVPMPIVMGMVAGVFLRFGLDLVRALHDDFVIAGPMAITWIVLSVAPALGRRMPPLIGALLVGVGAALIDGRFAAGTFAGLDIIQPVIQAPAWSLAAAIELVVPLAITVLVVQNGQGIAVLRAVGHQPPVNAITAACGIGSVVSAVFGGVSSCLTGPTNAIVSSSGENARHYTAGIFVGLLALVFGLLAPTFTRFLLDAPAAFVMTLAGLALLKILQAAFSTCFGDRFTLGALVAFLVTVADLPLFNIGAAFWGLVAGILVSRLLERDDFTRE